MKKKIAIFLLLLILGFTLSFFIVRYIFDDSMEQQAIKEVKKDKKLQEFVYAWIQMKENYYTQMDSETMLQRSLSGLKNNSDNYTIIKNSNKRAQSQTASKSQNYSTVVLKDDFYIIKPVLFNRDEILNITPQIRDIAENHNNNNKHYVIDLRDNPGGEAKMEALLYCMLNPVSSVKVSLVDSKGTTKNQDFEEEFKKSNLFKGCDLSKGIVDFFRDKKFILWFNHNTGSAAEIFISKLMLNKRVELSLGERTYGKGIVQNNVYSNNEESNIHMMYTEGVISLNGKYTPQKYGIYPDYNIIFEGEKIKRMEDSVFINPPEGLIAINKETQHNFSIKDEELIKNKDEAYLKLTKDILYNK